MVCDLHGGAAPQVRRRAAERALMTADEAMQVIQSFMHDKAIPPGIRLKAAQDMADRAGLVAAQVHKIVPADVNDPVESLFRSLLDDPDGLVAPAPAPPALEAGQVVQGEVVGDPAQEAIDRLEESWTPDAEVRPLRPADFGKVGPHAYRDRDPNVENGDPRPAPPVPGWRPPDDIA